MDIDTKIDIVKSEPTEEILTEEQLRSLLETNDSPNHYIGLEISGMLHIGHVLVAGKKINDFAKIGAKTNIFLADWHSFANNKLGGDWDRIINGSKFYKKLFNIVCPDAKIVLGSELYQDNDDYWKEVMKLATKTTMARATRTLLIEGRKENDTLHVSQYLYPMMQAADLVAMDIDIAHAGMDQRRIHVLAKEVFKSQGLKDIVSVHHHLLASMLKPPLDIPENSTKEEIVAEMKMSKSKPGSAISILATDEEIKKTIAGAWCPERTAAGNPVLELCKYLIVPQDGKLNITRDDKFGGDVEYVSYTDIEKDFVEGKLHPTDLKNGVYEVLSRKIGDVRRHFDNDEGREMAAVFSDIKR